MNAGAVNFSRIERVIFGQPAHVAVATQVDDWGSERVLVVASRSLHDQTDVVGDIAAAIGDRCVEVVVGIPEHTPSGTVMSLTARATELDVDTILTVGGGSVIDAAKAVRMCLANDVSAMEDLGDDSQPGGTSPRPPAVKQIAVPTTLSAAEFTGIAGVTDESTHVKALWRHPELAPDCVVLDPQVTAHTPAWLFLSTGLRAVDHAVEGFCAASANAYTDAQAARGLGLLLSGLAAVHANPDDLEARLACQVGAWMAMCPLACGVPMGASHGVGYVLGAAHGVPHGYTSCVMLPAVLEWNAETNHERQAELARLCGVDDDLAGVIRGLVRTLQLPGSLTEVGIGVEHYADVAAGAMGTAWVPHNPRPIESASQVLEVLALAE